MGKINHLIKSDRADQAKKDAEFARYLSGSLSNISEFTNSAEQIRAVLAEHVDVTDAIRNDLNQSKAAIEQAINREVTSVVYRLIPEFNALANKIQAKAVTSADLTILQSRLVEALSRITIPDYSAQLERLERRTVDLKPILDRLDAMASKEMDEEKEPAQWKFQIERHDNGMIKSVLAVEE